MKDDKQGVSVKVYETLKAELERLMGEHKLALADAQFIGYNHGRFEHIIELVQSMGLTRDEWKRWKKEYPPVLTKGTIEELDEYFNKNF